MPLDQIPSKQRSQSEKAIQEYDARERKTSESRAGKAESVVEDGHRKVHDLVGSKNLSVLREAMEQENKALRDLREPPGGLTLDFDKANKARKRRVDSVVNKLGIDPKQLRKIGRTTGKKLDEVLGTPAGTVTSGFNLSQNLSKWTELSPLHRFPLDWGVRPREDAANPNRFRIFGPDFPFWNLAFDTLHSSGFRTRREFTLFEELGAVGNFVTMDCPSASDFDFAHAIVDAEVVFIYEAPRAGRLEVIVDATSSESQHALRITNEIGFSSHETNQKNHLSLNVFHPNVTERSLSLMSHFRRTGVSSPPQSESPLTPGAHYYGHMVSNGTVQAGEMFFVGVGTRTFDITHADDVRVHSSSNFQWLIRSAEVRIVP